MIDNVFVQCNYCKTKLRLRFQMGYFNIPFDICCPECGVHISGLRDLENEHSMSVRNASIFDGEPNSADYFADFSVELPHAKIKKYKSLEEIVEMGFSPFMMTSRLYEYETYLKLIKQMKHFLAFRDSYWPELMPLFDLYFNDKIPLTREHFLKLSPRFVVNNELDALMALHQTTVLGMNSILPDGSLTKFMSVSNQITAPEFLSKTDALMTTLGGKEYYTSISKRLIKIYDRWMSSFEKYIPATMLSLGNAAYKLDKELFGIATTSFEDMKSLYADSYELILDFISVAIGLNNIAVRGDCNSFPPNDIRVNKGTACVSCFADYKEIVKFSRLSLMIESEPFSKSIPIHRNVRNAIAHFDYDFDAGTQKITFHDKYKNRENNIELYLIDLALLCYENITILVYLDELLYNLRKIDCLNRGMAPSIKASK